MKPVFEWCLIICPIIMFMGTWGKILICWAITGNEVFNLFDVMAIVSFYWISTVSVMAYDHWLQIKHESTEGLDEILSIAWISA